MRTFGRRQLIRGLAGIAAWTSVPLVGCASPDSDGEESSAGALQSRDEALRSIDKIVVLMMENRSFDHFFGHLTIPKDKGGEGAERFDPTRDRQIDGDRRINGLTGNEWNPREPGAKEDNSVHVFHAKPKYGFAIGNITHEFDACHNQWDPILENGAPTGRGRMDGFVIEHLRDRGDLSWSSQWAGAKPEGLELTRCGGFVDLCAHDSGRPGRQTCAGALGILKSEASNKVTCAQGDAPMSYYVRADTPVYHSFIDEYVLCDAWHASVMGPTWPNRFYAHSATSGGETGNAPHTGLDTIWNVLRDGGVDATNFFADVPLCVPMYGHGDTVDFKNPRAGSAVVFEGRSPLSSLFSADTAKDALRRAAAAVALDKSFERRCQDGSLPPVSFIEPPYFSADDHPPHDVHLGQAFVKCIYNMLYGERANQDQAQKTLLVIVYDEHGSFYDHHDPGLAADKSTGPKDSNSKFRPLGFRVPAMIVGPMVKRAHVSHTVYDHTSIIATIMRWARLKGHALREFKTSTYDGVTYDPNRRIQVANDIGDCLELDGARRRDPIKLPPLDIREVDALAAMEWNEGQTGFAQRYGVEQPGLREKRDSCRVVMEHLERLGAARIG